MTILQMVGIGLVVLGIIAFFIWLTQSSKAGKIRTVPFKKPSEILQLGMGAADAKQMVSTEGAMTGQPISGAMSGKQCVYYEIEITRGYHTTSRNAQGQTTKSHSTKPVMNEKTGSIFALGDGSSAIGIDCTKAPSMDLVQSHRHRFNVGLVPPTQIQFGNLTLQTESLASAVAGLLLGSENTDYYEGVERMVPFVPNQTFYALGKLTQAPQGLKIGDGREAVMLSDKGREGALGTAARNAKLALIGGAVMLLSGTVCSVLGFVVMRPAAPPAHAAAAAAKGSPPPAAAPPKKK
jgi:hypothetical protein